MTKRDPSLDVFRGIAILEVLLHHVTAFAMRKTTMGSVTHDLYAVVNRTLHFAVPAFLFIMAVLLTRIVLVKAPTWREFYTRRVQQTLAPYLVWTSLYAVFRVWMVPHQNPPAFLRDPEKWQYWLLWGKAWYHLYFMVLAVQLYLAFPLVLALLRRLRPGFGVLLVTVATAQCLVQLAQERWRVFPFPGTLLLWNLIPAFLGVWVGVNLPDWDEVWRRYRPLALLLALAGWAVYLPLAYQQAHETQVDSRLYHAAFWAYSTGVTLCVFQLARKLSRGRAAAPLQWLGTLSLQIYLVHPMLLHFWSGASHSGGTLRFHLTTVVVLVTLLGASLLVAFAADRLGIGTLLFGRTVRWPARGGAAAPGTASGG